MKAILFGATGRIGQGVPPSGVLERRHINRL
jgi:hypothetical protein